MIIQVVLGQVGKEHKIEPAIANSVKVDGVGSNFHDNMSDAVFEHLCQNLLEIQRFRCCHGVLICLSGITVI